MGQSKRRKAEINQVKATSANCRSVAAGVSEYSIHEAGHAVGRFMTAKLWGYEPHDAVSYIEMRRPDAAPIVGKTVTTTFKAVATTYGPMFPADMTAVAKSLDLNDVDSILAEARKTGTNIEIWASGQMAINLGGVVAEMIATGETTIPTGWENDIAHARKVAATVGWSEQQTTDVMEAYLMQLREKFRQHAIWNGLVALAKALPVEGRMEGRDAWEIFSRALNDAAI